VIGASFGNRNRWHVFSVRGIRVFAHVSLPLGFLIVSRLSIAPLTWLAFVLIVLAHELGHAFLLRLYRLPVFEIVLHMAGGECRTTAALSGWQRVVVAWGGILGQLALFSLVASLTTLGVLPKVVLQSDFYYALTAMNLTLAAVNLLPIEPLDGRDALRLPWLCWLQLRVFWLRLQVVRETRKKAKARSHLRRLH
jgi:stage IV sporulation protein FB